MGTVEAILGYSTEALLVLAIAAFAVPFWRIFKKLIKGEYSPSNLADNYREGKQEVEE